MSSRNEANERFNSKQKTRLLGLTKKTYIIFLAWDNVKIDSSKFWSNSGNKENQMKGETGKNENTTLNIGTYRKTNADNR